jgi:hypothetical protein
MEKKEREDETFFFEGRKEKFNNRERDLDSPIQYKRL